MNTWWSFWKTWSKKSNTSSLISIKWWSIWGLVRYIWESDRRLWKHL